MTHFSFYDHHATQSECAHRLIIIIQFLLLLLQMFMLLWYHHLYCYYPHYSVHCCHP